MRSHATDTASADAVVVVMVVMVVVVVVVVVEELVSLIIMGATARQPGVLLSSCCRDFTFGPGLGNDWGGDRWPPVGGQMPWTESF